MRKTGVIFALGATALLLASTAGAGPEIAAKPSSLSPRLREAIDRGPAPAREVHRIVVSLALRSPEVLDAYLADVQDPASPLHGRFLSFHIVEGPGVSRHRRTVARSR